MYVYIYIYIFFFFKQIAQYFGLKTKPCKQINCWRAFSETRLSSIWETSSFFQMQYIYITLRFDFKYLLLFCMVAKYKRATLTRSPDSPRERELLLFTIMVLRFLCGGLCGSRRKCCSQGR